MWLRYVYIIVTMKIIHSWDILFEYFLPHTTCSHPELVTVLLTLCTYHWFTPNLPISMFETIRVGICLIFSSRRHPLWSVPINLEMPIISFPWILGYHLSLWILLVCCIGRGQQFLRKITWETFLEIWHVCTVPVCPLLTI